MRHINWYLVWSLTTRKKASWPRYEFMISNIKFESVYTYLLSGQHTPIVSKNS